LENANKPSLIKATLETLLRFLNWIPLGYIFETQIIDYLVTRVGWIWPRREGNANISSSRLPSLET